MLFIICFNALDLIRKKLNNNIIQTTHKKVPFVNAFLFLKFLLTFKYVLGLTHMIAEKQQRLSYNIELNEQVEYLTIRCCIDDYFEPYNIISYPTTPGYKARS